MCEKAPIHTKPARVKRNLIEMLYLRLTVAKNAMKSANTSVISTELNSSVFFVEKITSPTKKNRALNNIRFFAIICFVMWKKVTDQI